MNSSNDASVTCAPIACEEDVVVYECYATTSPSGFRGTPFIGYKVYRERFTGIGSIQQRLEEICWKLYLEVGPSFIHGSAHHPTADGTYATSHSLITLDGDPIPLGVPLQLS